MQLLFVDESNPAPKFLGARSARYFVLAGVAVPELNWHSLARTLGNIKRQWDINGESDSSLRGTSSRTIQ